MASEVDISNLSLSHLGDDATVSSISPPEGSVQAEHCARFYPIARDALLEMHDWKFATKRKTGALLSAEVSGWAYVYAFPSATAIKVIAVLPPEAADDADSQPFECETLSDGSVVIYTDQDDADLRFIDRVKDTTKFSPLFTVALSRLLASYLAGPVLKGKSGRDEAKGQMQIFASEFAKAAGADAVQKKSKVEHKVGWISARS
jgi:hypothetical protein